MAKGAELGRQRNVCGQRKPQGLSRFILGVATRTLDMVRKNYSLENTRGRSPKGVTLPRVNRK